MSLLNIAVTSLLISVFSLCFSPNTNARLLYDEDFESGQLGSNAQLSCTDSSTKFSIQTNTVRNGNYAASLGNAVDAGGRCEVIPGRKNGGDFFWGEEYWVGFSFNIPHNNANEGWRAFHQHHSAVGDNVCNGLTGGNGFSIFQYGDDLSILLTPSDQLNEPSAKSAGSNQSKAYTFPLEINKWFDVVMNFRYSDTDNGFWKIWINGQLVINRTGSNVNLFDYCGGYKARWYLMKYGIYSGNQGNGDVYYDNVRIGDSSSSYEEVSSTGEPSPPPSGNNNPDLTTYWVDDNGTASWAQSKNENPLSGSAASSLATANANAKAGDLIYLRGGNYTTTIEPNNSGTSTQPIVFKRYENESAVFDGLNQCITLFNKHYITVDGIQCFRTRAAWAEIQDGSSYNEIKNSQFETAFNYTGIGITTDAHHNKIQSNSFRSTCTRTTPCLGNGDGTGSCFEEGGPGDSIYMTGDRNLIMDNNFLQGGTHYAIATRGDYNIFKGNRFHNTWHGNLGSGGKGPMYGNLIENNTFLESGIDRLTNFCGQGRDRDMPPNKQNQYGSAHTNNIIMRGNVFIGGGKVASSNWRGNITNQRIYNNTFYRNIINYKLEGTSPDYLYDGEVFLNNISAQAVEADLLVTGPATWGNSICNNNTWSTTGSTTTFGSNDTCNNSNLSVDPKFVNEASTAINSDLRLQASSPMRDAGAWLTTIASNSGTGNTFKVADAGFFSDGYGLIAGDEIQLEGQNNRARITLVDYSTNTLTVESNISWNKGVGVALPYSGSKPDIGAYEYTDGSNPPPTTNTAPVAVDDTANINNHNPTGGTAYDATVLALNPISYWRLGETSGTTAVDQVGNENGLYNGGVTQNQGGALMGDNNSAAGFDGSNDYIHIPHNNSFQLNDGAFSFWFKTNTIAQNSGLISKDAFGYGAGGHFSASLNNGMVTVRIQNTTASLWLGSTTVISPNVWQNVVINFGSAGLSLYINGQLQASENYTGGISANTEPLVLGAQTNHSDAGSATPLRDFFQGQIDELALFNTALSASQVQTLYNAATNTAEGIVINVLANDSDADNDDLTIASITQGSQGQVINSQSHVIYIPASSFSGVDTFTYSISDGNGGSDQARVSVQTNQSNTAPVITTINDLSLTIGDSVNLALSASDSEGDNISFSLINAPALASIVNTGNGQATLTLSPTLAGDYSITVQADDGALSSRQSFALVVNTANNTDANPPVLANLNDLSLLSGASTTVDVQASDADGDDLTLSATGLPNGSTFVDLGNGQGRLSFNTVAKGSYQVTVMAQSRQRSASQTFNVNVTDTPVTITLVNDTATMAANSSLTIDVLANDSGNSLAITAITQGSNGSVVNHSSSLSYTPNAGFSGSDSFTYTVGTASASVNVTINPATQTRGQSRIQPYAANPFYWQYKGQPILLLGGSDNDDIHNWSGTQLTNQLDLLVSQGGNYLRDVVTSNDNATGVYPFKRTNSGKFDLNQWDEAWWSKIDNLLRETQQRDIIVSFELWNAFGFTSIPQLPENPWANSPWNPKNNINYTQAGTGIPEVWNKHPSFSDNPFVKTTPGQNNVTAVLSYQEKFIREFVTRTLAYDNAIYIIQNESAVSFDWPNHWASLLHSTAAALGEKVEVADMRDKWDLSDAEHEYPIDRPNLYTFVDISQNNHNSAQLHYDRVQYLRNNLRNDPTLNGGSAVIRPMNNVKIYGANTGSSGSDTDGIERFWRNVFGGAASARFHRPSSGLALGNVAQKQIKSARMATDALDIFSAIPNNALLSSRSSDEAYALVDSNQHYAVYFSGDGDGRVVLDLASAPTEWQLKWLNVNASSWGASTALGDVENVTLQRPNSGQWVALVVNEAAANTAPLINPINDVTLMLGDSLDINVSGSDNDGDNINFSLIDPPTFASITNTGNGQATITLAATATGSYVITVQASDGVLSSRKTFAVFVDTATNPDANPPILANLNSLVLSSGDSATLNVYASDADGDAITLSASGLPNGSDFVDLNNGQGRLNFNAVAQGSYFITVTAQSRQRSASQIFSLTVENNPTTITLRDDSANVNKNASVLIDVLANDSGNNLAITAITQGANGTVVNNTTSLSYTPNIDFSGNDTFTYTVGNASATVNMQINTNSQPNTGPSIGSVEAMIRQGHHYLQVLLQGELPLHTAIWQISPTAEFTEQLFNKRVQHQDALVIPLGLLTPENSYWVRVRYIDRVGNLSSWSAPFQFTTPIDANDNDGNGTDDRYQVNSEVDIYDNGVLVPPTGLCYLYDAQTNSVIGFKSNVGEINCYTAYNKPHLLEVTDRILPYGLFNFKVSQLAVDIDNPSEIEVVIYFPSNLEADMQWLRFDEPQNALSNISDKAQLDGNRITLHLIDGGENDADGEINGVISHTSGPSPKINIQTITTTLLGEDGGGAFGLGLLFSMLLLKLYCLHRINRLKSNKGY